MRVRGDGSADMRHAIELPGLDGQPAVQEVADREPAPVEVAVMEQTCPAPASERRNARREADRLRPVP